MFDEGVSAYLGVASPNFPNFFMLGGPYSLGATHSSLLSAEFQGAFKQLKVDPEEMRLLCGATDRGWFAYRTILFVVGPGPHGLGPAGT